MELLPEITEKFTPDLLLSMAEIQQSRSDFQLEKFVVNQHDTEEMRYLQTVIELQHLYYTIKTVSLEMKKTEVEIKRLRETEDEIDEIDAQLKELGLEQTRLVGIGAFRELDSLMAIYNSFEHKYTRAEIEAAQPDYWNKRLSRQATLEAIGGTQAQAAHLDSLRQIGALEMAPEGGIRAVSQEMQQITGNRQKNFELEELNG
jgi:anion-transporting  ArsA/GET3 family ATPase